MPLRIVKAQPRASAPLTRSNGRDGEFEVVLDRGAAQGFVDQVP